MRNSFKILICCQLFAASISAQEVGLSPNAKQGYSRAGYGLVGPVHQITENSNESPVQPTIIFDKQGNILEVLMHVVNDLTPGSKKTTHLLGKGVYTYNSAGKLDKIAACFGETVCPESLMYYDASGRIKEVREKNADGFLTPARVYSYEASKVSYVDFEDPGKGSKPIRTSVSTLEAPGKWIRVHYKPDGSIDVKFVYTFDSRNNLTEEVIYDEKDSVFVRKVFTYKFDSHGNWIERQNKWMMGDGKVAPSLGGVAHRVIKYY